MKIGHMHRYILFGMSDDLSEIIVLKLAPKDATYDELVVDLKAARDLHQCRYAVFSADYDKGGVNRNKIISIFWNPSEATVKQKMLYASSHNTFKQELEKGQGGIALSFSVGDDDEIQWESIKERLLSNDKYF